MSTAQTPSGRLSFAKIREPLEVPDLLALQTESFDWLLGNERWAARLAEGKKQQQADDVPHRRAWRRPPAQLPVTRPPSARVGRLS